MSVGLMSRWPKLQLWSLIVTPFSWYVIIDRLLIQKTMCSLGCLCGAVPKFKLETKVCMVDRSSAWLLLYMYVNLQLNIYSWNLMRKKRGWRGNERWWHCQWPNVGTRRHKRWARRHHRQLHQRIARSNMATGSTLNFIVLSYLCLIYISES